MSDTTTTTTKPRNVLRRPLSWWQATLGLLVIFGCLPVSAQLWPAVFIELREPGSITETLGWASNEVPSGDPTAVEKQALIERVEAILGSLPGSDGTTVYVKDDLDSICGAGAAACTFPGSATIWVSTGADIYGQLLEIVTHEYIHTQTNLLESAYLRLHPELFPNVNLEGSTVALEGIADCGVQLLVDDWSSDDFLPYVAGLCTPEQMTLTQNVLADRWLPHGPE